MKTRIRLWVKIVFFVIIFTITIFIYGRLINTKGFNVREYAIKDNLPNDYKIVQISDINYKRTTDKKDLEKIIDRINFIKPDIVVFTGDLLNNSINYSNEDIEDITKLLNKIDVTIDKLAIKGEEDNNKYFDTIMNNSGFIILNNEYKLIYNNSKTPIMIAGINNIKDNFDSTLDYLNSNDIYSILLIHKPDEIKKIDYNKFNLILAGHSLNGYINIPILKNLFLPDGATDYYQEYYKLDNTKLYISNGIGTKSIKFRILNKPSFNFFRLIKK